MVVYAETAVPASSFSIGRAFAELPGVAVEMDRIVPTVDAVVPFVWVRGASPEDVVRVTRAHGAVEEIRRLHEEDGRTLYRVVWNRAFRDAVVHIAGPTSPSSRGAAPRRSGASSSGPMKRRHSLRFSPVSRRATSRSR